MKDKDVYKQLEGKCQTGYRINELIPFAYPIRRIKMDVLVNKQPDASLVKVYNVILRAMRMGFDTTEALFDFLGLNHDDEFMIRELYSLKEKRYVDLVSDKWCVSAEGEQFINDNAILRIEEEEEFEFLLDGISGEVIFPESIKMENIGKGKDKDLKFLDEKLNLPVKSPELLDGKHSDLTELFKKQNANEALISYDKDNIKNDYKNWCLCWLVEYIPDTLNSDSYESKLEVRIFNSLKEIKYLTKKFNSEYQHYIYILTDSNRNEIEVLPEIVKMASEKPFSIPQGDIVPLGIWKTKESFIDALRTVKEKILIESPWIKQAIQEYIPFFKELLKKKKRLIIIYGISEKDEHHVQILKELEELQNQNRQAFSLIHLPTHFKKHNPSLTGTHRKLLIKDNEYYISGSFNFLSFGKHEQDKVANEESHLIRKDVKEKWEQVMNEYSISIH